MKYKIKLVQDWYAPYMYGDNDDKNICRHVETEEYETESIDLCKKILGDLLDAPEAELSLDQVKEDFSADPDFYDIDESSFVSIQRYYNGRLGILRKANEYVDTCLDAGQSFRLDIPEDYNHFEVRGKRPDTERQNEAYIEIEITQ